MKRVHSEKRRRDIRNKMIRAHILLLVMMWCILLISTAVAVSSDIQQQTQFFLLNNVQMADKQLHELVAAMKSCSNSVMLSMNQESTLNEEPQEKTALTRYNAITVQLFLISRVYQDVESMLFVDTAGQVYATSRELESRLDQDFLTQHNKILDDASGRSLFLGMIQSPSGLPQEMGSVMMMGKRIIRIQDGKTLGYLYLAIPEKQLADMLDKLKYIDNSTLILCDTDGTVLSAVDKTMIGQPSGKSASTDATDSMNSNGNFWDWNGWNPVVGYRQAIPDLNFELVYTVPAKDLFAGTVNLLLVMLGLGVLGAVLSITFARHLSNKLTLPILRLTDEMRQVTYDNLLLHSTVETNDEVGVLAQGFNHMLDRIHELLEKVTLEQREKAQKEIALLQNQIKPHFLYNTLNTIYTLCVMGEGETAAKATKSLAEHYQYSLSGGRNSLSIQEELACVEKYLDIQCLAYRDRLSVGIICNPEVALYNLPKMTIQPIVENAIVHGLKPRNGGSLLVQVTEEEDHIVIRVTDDGVGMNLARQSSLLDQESSSGFGLKNVRERLELYFGGAATIHIASTEDYGTTVSVTLPKRYKAEMEE